MATVTPNFNWPVPTSTDLVKDGATAIEALGDSIDGSLVDLKGGTTGQVLSKTSNTDMDFTWVTTDDANAIQNSIVDAKGDLIAASANDTPARLAVGNNGETLVADSSTSTGLRYIGNFAAGKNKIINGDFRINQRAFSSSTSGTGAVYNFDRWMQIGSGGTTTWSAQTFTLGAAPVAGYEGTNFLQIASTGQSAAGDNSRITQKIESVRTFAGDTVTVSFWAKATSGTPSFAAYFYQDFGTGGSPSAGSPVSGNKVTLSTSWARYTITIAIPSISGKTIGTNNNDSLWLVLVTSGGSDFNTATNSIGIQTTTIQMWGLQVESGSVASAFQTATGTLQGELAACQRYFQRFASPSGEGTFGFFMVNLYSTTAGYGVMPAIVTMRTTPTLGTTGTASNYRIYQGGFYTLSSISLQSGGTNQSLIAFSVSSSITSGGGGWISPDSGGNGYLEFRAEL
jgi:hypothetical protein